MTEFGIEGVFVGRPSVLGYRGTKPVLSAITKAAVDVPELTLTELNLDGDDQADRTVHGGVDKAVYVYPAAHYPAWEADGFPGDFGFFGENVTVSGPLEDDVRIGDVWAWGDALLQVSQPRRPCFKMVMKAGRPDVVPMLVDSGRSGWYLRVLRTGTVPTTGSLRLVSRSEGPTIAEVYLVSFANFAQLPQRHFDAALALAERVLATPELADQYRRSMESTVERWRVRRAG